MVINQLLRKDKLLISILIVVVIVFITISISKCQIRLSYLIHENGVYKLWGNYNANSKDELVIVIGKRIKNVNSEEAEKAIFGYSLGADVEGNPDSYYKVHHEPEDPNKAPLTLGLKIGDGFAPFGPFITQDVNWKKSMKHVSIVNKKTSKNILFKHYVSNLIFLPVYIVSQLSKILTLYPMNVIFSGSSRAFVVDPGDKIRLSIEGLGSISDIILASDGK